MFNSPRIYPSAFSDMLWLRIAQISDTIVATLIFDKDFFVYRILFSFAVSLLSNNLISCFLVHFFWKKPGIKTIWSGEYQNSSPLLSITLIFYFLHSQKAQNYSILHQVPECYERAKYRVFQSLLQDTAGSWIICGNEHYRHSYLLWNLYYKSYALCIYHINTWPIAGVVISYRYPTKRETPPLYEKWGSLNHHICSP